MSLFGGRSQKKWEWIKTTEKICNLCVTGFSKERFGEFSLVILRLFNNAYTYNFFLYSGIVCVIILFNKCVQLNGVSTQNIHTYSQYKYLYKSTVSPAHFYATTIILRLGEKFQILENIFWNTATTRVFTFCNPILAIFRSDSDKKISFNIYSSM